MQDGNTETSRRWPDWLGVLVCSLAHLTVCGVIFLFCTSGVLGLYDAVSVLIVAYWVLAFPVAVAEKCGLPAGMVLFLVLLLANSLLYGVFWWFTYRMYRLMLRPAEKEPT